MPVRRPITELLLVSRFVVAGLVNTAVGLAIILALDVGLAVPPAVANALGYAVGIGIAWLMHRGFVFRASYSGWRVKSKYLATVALAFGLNQLVLIGARHVAGATPEGRTVAQMLAVVTYSAVQFIVLRVWVFDDAGRRR